MHFAVQGRAPGERLRLTSKLGYGVGQFVDGIVNNTLSVFLLFYLTTVCGLPGGLAGAALAIGIVSDAVLDPLIGTLSDGWQSRLGRRLPFMLMALAPLTASFILLFWLPRTLGHLALFAWVAALSITLRVSMSLFILPYQAVGAELSEDYAERSSLMAWRWGIGMVGAVIAVALGFGVFFAGQGGLSHREAYPRFAVSLVALVLAGAAISCATTYFSRARLHLPSRGAGRLGTRVFRELAEVFRNHSFRVLFIGALLFFTALGINASLGLHANTFFWRLSESQTQFVTLALFAGLLCGAPLAGPFAGRVEKRTVLMIGMAGLAMAQGGPVTLRLVQLLPWTGDLLARLLAATMFGGGVLMAAAAIAFSSMMADAADEHEHLFGGRREALFFAGWAFASKAALGGGALVAGLVLQVIHFPTDLAARGGSAAILPPRMVNALAIFYGPGAAVLFLASVAICMLYRLDRRTHAVVMLDLHARRRVAEAGSLSAH